MKILRYALLVALSVSSALVPFQAGTTYLVMIIDKLGLANRLRIMAGMYSISKQANRRLLVLWSPSVECGSSFSDLFEDVAVGVEVLDIAPASHATITKELVDLAYKQSMSLQSLYLTDFDVNISYIDTKYNSTAADVILAFTLGTHSPAHACCRDYLFAKSTFYRSLLPVASIRSTVNAITDRHFSKNVIVGIHVRAFDSDYDWEVVPPDSDSDDKSINTSEALRFDQVASLTSFVRVISDISTSIPQAKYFIASNSPLVVEEILRLYLHPENIIYVDATSMTVDCRQEQSGAACKEESHQGRSTALSVQMVTQTSPQT